MEKKDLIQRAIAAMDNAYVPYSGFYVGAALLTDDGKVFCGCNIENASYPAGICAERTAFVKAVSEGEKGFKKIVVVGGKNKALQEYCSPCGICRQVMREFVNPEEFKVIVAKSPEEYQEFTLAQLLPESFGPDNLV